MAYDLAYKTMILKFDFFSHFPLSNFDEPLLKAHTQTLKELIQRDKNRPAVIMWSIGNEPQSAKASAANYFKYIP